MANLDRIREQYDENRELYSNYAKKTAELLRALLKKRGLKIHSTPYRLKPRDSLLMKILDHEGKYQRLSDITDIAGIRVICYFEDEVNQVAELVKQEFKVDEENSVDKRVLLDPDRFGYLSLHYVISLGDERKKLPEYSSFSDLKAELQIRSILQHAWAEIEHDFGYKTKEAVPHLERRQFSRLAGLLELADAEFVGLRNSLSDYTQNVPNRIKQDPGSVTVDKESLTGFIRSSSMLRAQDEYIAGLGEATLLFSSSYVERLVQGLTYFDINTIESLKHELRSNESFIKDLANCCLRESLHTTPDDGLPYPEGIAVFYLCYVIAARTKNQDTICRYLKQMSIRTTGERELLAKKLVEWYKQSRQGESNPRAEI